MFEQAFRNIDDVLRKEAGCTTELDYTEQTSWLLFLKYLDGLEQDRATVAKLEGKKYSYILDKDYRWNEWAAPKGKDGKVDHNKAMTGYDLSEFVIQKLFPYLHGFKQRATGPDTIEYKIGEIFGEIKNKINSGYNLREIIDHIDELSFRSQSEKHELSHLYEAKIRNMGNAGRNGGEYYTPRPLIRAMVKVVAPKIGETIYDGACGSAGFLCESFDYLKADKKLTTRDVKILQERTFYGKEKKSLAYVIAIMNMILHGIEAPNVKHTNTLTENLADVQQKDRYDIVLANPPFGGKERKEVQQNFTIKTGETAFLFLQHFIKMLKAGGRGAVVIKNTFLSNTDNASVSLRKLLLETCNLHTVLDCPGGTFQGAGVKTVVLFFEKGSRTRKVWYYQLDPGRNMGKTNPLNDDDLKEFIELQKTFADSAKSWSVDVKDIDQTTFDLSVKNPNGGELLYRTPKHIIDAIAALDQESEEALSNIKAIESNLQSVSTQGREGWVEKTLESCCVQIFAGGDVPKDRISQVRTPKYSVPIFSNGEKDDGLYGFTDVARVTKPSITVSARGTLGFTAIRTEPFLPVVRLIVLIPDEKLIMLSFLYYAVVGMHFGNTGTSIPQLTVPNFKESRLYVPSLPEQKVIVEILDALREETQYLESIYQRKLAALDELKKSLLHQAFSGQL